MRAILLLLIFLVPTVHARPMDIMNLRLKAYKDTTPVECGDPFFKKSGLALKVGVGCSYKCIEKAIITTKVDDVFSPEEMGLRPGNGSSSDKIIWSSLNIGLKTWSEKVCLQEAANACGGLSRIEDVSMGEVSSGQWKIKKFPTCNETSITLSPFDNSAGSEQYYKGVGDLVKNIHRSEEQSPNYTFKMNEFALELPINDDSDQKCSKKIVGKICYGDCIDMNSKGDSLTETLGTPEPLGADTVEVCADEFYGRLRNEKISLSAKKVICENYFWTTIMKGRISINSCAAVRGDVDCSAVIQ